MSSILKFAIHFTRTLHQWKTTKWVTVVLSWSDVSSCRWSSILSIWEALIIFILHICLQYEFFKTYLGASEKDEVTEDNLYMLFKEANTLAQHSHFLWGIWSIVQDLTSSIDFDYSVRLLVVMSSRNVTIIICYSHIKLVLVGGHFHDATRNAKWGTGRIILMWNWWDWQRHRKCLLASAPGSLYNAVCDSFSSFSN